jgi:tetratricopeptide (TPR) repeat protein
VGQWDRDLADFSKLVELNPINAFGWHFRRAVLYLKLGDRKAYSQTCRTVLDTFRWEPFPAARAYARWVIQTCVLGPDAGVESGRVVTLAEKLAAENARNRSDQTNLGAALYRAGRFEEAVRQLDKAAGLPPDPFLVVEDTWCFLAMAHQRPGHAEEAGQWPEKAQKPKEPTNTTGLPWDRRLTLQLLRHEAEALLGINDEKTPHQNTKDTGKQP